MAEINIDAALVRDGGMVKADGALVEMQVRFALDNALCLPPNCCAQCHSLFGHRTGAYAALFVKIFS